MKAAREPEAFAAELRAVLEAWASPALPPRVTVGFSGGLDSTVLLAALCRLDWPVRVRAAHVDHGLHPHSADWRAHCAAAAADLGAEFAASRVAVDRTSKQGLEAAAREARYRALGELLAPGEWLLTAHHADDQLETLLLRLLRGTGVRGLRGILPFAPFHSGWLGRPLLAFTREELRSQAEQSKLAWIEDPSNLDERHDRNYLRARVLPALRARWPTAAQHGVRLAQQMTDAERLLESVAAEDAHALAAAWHLPRSALAPLEPARQRNLLRHLLRAVDLAPPSARTLDELRTALLEARAESRTHVRWPGGEGRVFGEALYLMAPLPPPSPPDYAAHIGVGSTWLGPEGRLALAPARDGAGLPQSWLDDGLTLRFRAGGERFKPLGREHHHSLKSLFQERGIVPWMRGRVPLLFHGAALAAIGDLWVSAHSGAAPAAEPRWRVEWTQHPPVQAPERR